MNVCVLASGSSGNSAFVESGDCNILVDAGISARSISEKLSALGKELKEIDAVFITHEHTDHIRGLERLSRLGIRVYLNKPTFGALSFPIRTPRFFENDKPIELGSFEITPISIRHDAASPCGFCIKEDGATIGIFTDFGRPNPQIKKIAREADCLVLETNHDIDMLINGPYPYHLKQRILGESGHLSNADAGILVKENATEKLKTVFLAHLSKHNNTPELALETFSRVASKNKSLCVKKIMTSQENSTELIEV